MFYFREVVVILWCVACVNAACSNATVCVVSGRGREVECQQYHVIQRLSDLTINELGCKSVHIYLTSGKHTLNKNIDFDYVVEDTKIHGVPQGQATIIACENKAGIRFSESSSSKVSISDIVFLQCNREIKKYKKRATLYFRNVFYMLQNVAINNADGYGLYVRDCKEQTIINCTFNSNVNGHIKVVLENYSKAVIDVNQTRFHGERNQNSSARARGGIKVYLSENVQCTLNVINCEFQIMNDSHLLVQSNSTNVLVLNIENSIFNISSKFPAVSITSTGADSNFKVTVQGSTFSNNANGALRIHNAQYVEITSCMFTYNSHAGIVVQMSASSADVATIYIMNNCSIIKTSVMIEGNQNNEVVLENSTFEGNQGIGGDCSALDVSNVNNLILRDIDIVDNYCTGIKLSSSTIKFENTINLMRNIGLQGGAISLKGRDVSDLLSIRIFSKLIINNSSEVNIINNTANTYGGGIYTDETCEKRNVDTNCFFQFETDYSLSKVFTFSGNSAKHGGDIIFGGCLSNCSVGVNNTVNKNDKKNILWNLMSFKNTRSRSTFIEYSKRVTFCETNDENVYIHGASCKASHDAVSVHRGEIFSVPLIVVNDFCFPSVEFMEAKVKEKSVHLQHDIFQQGRKCCYNFPYTVTGESDNNMTTTIFFNLQEQLSSDIPPAELTLNLKECPIGFEINSDGECDCQEKLNSYKIWCHSHNYSLDIPARTWVGAVSEGLEFTLLVHMNCLYCKNEGKQSIARFARGDSKMLCIANRQGLICGACIERYSLQLGGFECADCSKINSSYKGIILLIAFIVVGIALVFVLLGLNLTVSTGIINGLIFYSNIVYFNIDDLLPIVREGNGTHLQNTVRILSTFQAWMNLDFGITTCFFDGYDTYISTWMQFVFPFYIWLLILIIVMASRYSKKISKRSASNTVSVLATLLLLSYAKLLKTSIEAANFTDAEFLKNSSKLRVWILDGNIRYLHGKHIPLFLMSLLTAATYVLPFTLLILLGPLLQAKSHYRLLNWINKLKPFLDAFYGPYTCRYRYWPGILLLARMGIIYTFIIYSPNQKQFKLLSILMVTAVLFISWIIIGKFQAASLYQKKVLNHLELFFLLNLELFAGASICIAQFTKDTIKHQQGLAVAMVGSVLAVFCGILGYQILCTVSRYKTANIIIVKFFPAKMKGKEDASMDQNSTQKLDDISTMTTHSIVEMAECVTVNNNELREPLLANN